MAIVGRPYIRFTQNIVTWVGSSRPVDTRKQLRSENPPRRRRIQRRWMSFKVPNNSPRCSKISLHRNSPWKREAKKRNRTDIPKFLFSWWACQCFSTAISSNISVNPTIPVRSNLIELDLSSSSSSWCLCFACAEEEDDVLFIDDWKEQDPIGLVTIPMKRELLEVTEKHSFSKAYTWNGRNRWYLLQWNKNYALYVRVMYSHPLAAGDQ